MGAINIVKDHLLDPSVNVVKSTTQFIVSYPERCENAPLMFMINETNRVKDLQKVDYSTLNRKRKVLIETWNRLVSVEEGVIKPGTVILASNIRAVLLPFQVAKCVLETLKDMFKLTYCDTDVEKTAINFQMNARNIYLSVYELAIAPIDCYQLISASTRGLVDPTKGAEKRLEVYQEQVRIKSLKQRQIQTKDQQILAAYQAGIKSEQARAKSQGLSLRDLDDSIRNAPLRVKSDAEIQADRKAQEKKRKRQERKAARERENRLNAYHKDLRANFNVRESLVEEDNVVDQLKAQASLAKSNSFDTQVEDNFEAKFAAFNQTVRVEAF